MKIIFNNKEDYNNFIKENFNNKIINFVCTILNGTYKIIYKFN